MNLRPLYTLFYKEILRFAKVSFQTVGAPVVTALLYLVVFSHVLEDRVRVFEQVSYKAFLVPGLVMMSIIQNAFANSSSSLIQSKVRGNVIFILLSPLSYLDVYLAFILASVTRAILVGMGVYIVAVIIVPVPVYSVSLLVLFGFLSSAVLGTLGMIAGIWAERFDQLASFQNFVIIPLSFLSGAFYSLHSLPQFWQQLSRFNPFFYMIDGFRYGFFGVSDVHPGLSLVVVAVCLLGLGTFTLALLHRGYKLRT